MSNKQNISLFLSIFLFGFLQLGFSQNYNLDNESSFLEVHGTSSLHDWHVDAQEQSGTLKLLDTNIEELNFSVKSESLKSGKSAMDKKTFDALKTDKYKNIEFKLKSVNSSKQTSDNTYEVSARGTMRIAGKTKNVLMNFTLQIDDKQIFLQGEKPLLMTDYGVEPPKALLGTIKTGDEIKVVYKSVYKRSN